MATAFENATITMMSNPDFTETCTFRDSSVVCVSSAITEMPVLNEFGEDEGETFFLRIEARLLSAPPRKYERITFRGTTYKIDSFNLDASGLVWNIYLKSLTSRGS